MKKILLVCSAVASFFAANTLFAAPAFPEHCPAVAQIVAEKDTLKLNFDDSQAGKKEWFLWNNSAFGTPDGWSFAFGAVETNDMEEAQQKLIELLPTLELVKGPVTDREFGFTECDYAGANGTLGFAVNPQVLPDNGLMSRIRR